MSQTASRKDAIDALRSFNNAIVTSRLYPPAAPQVTSAVEHGYKGLRLFLARHGKLEIQLNNQQAFLDHFKLDDEVLSSFSTLLVYRPLERLGVGRLVFDFSMDRFAFAQIVSVFNATVEKISKEGGGLEYITSLGLAGYFSGNDLDEIEEGDDASHEEKPAPRKLLKVDASLLTALFGLNDSTDGSRELEESFQDNDEAVNLLAAGIGHVLRELHKKRMMGRSRLIPRVLSIGEEFVTGDDRVYVVQKLAKVLANSLKDPALCVLLLQEYPAGFGRDLYHALLNRIDGERLGTIIVLLREQLATAEAGEGAKGTISELIKSLLLHLTASEKGKQFVGSEKARKVLQEGEAARRKQRLQVGIRGILQGSVSPWQSAELLEYLPAAVSQMASSDDSSPLEILLQKLVNQLDTCETVDRSQFLNTLILICEKFVSDGRWSFIDPLVDRLIKWVAETGRSEESYERAAILLEHVMQHYWQSGNEERGDRILKLFYQIRSGSLPKSTIAKAIAGHAQDRGIDRSSLPDLLHRSLLDPHNDLLSFRLISQGPVAARFLVETLIESQDPAHRYKIIDLLSSADPLVAEIVQERLFEHMPWYGKCNLLKLLTATGDEDDADAALPFLNHEDFRVQREAFLCLYKIAGRRRRELLLLALANSSELIKIQVISALVRFSDPEIGTHLAELLTEYDNFTEENRDALLIQLLDTLGGCPCPAAAKAIKDFLKNRGRRAGRKISEPVWREAEKAMDLLENNQKKSRKWHVQASQLRKDAMRQAVKRGKTSPGERVITGLAEEQSIRILLGRGEEEEARKKLVQLIAQTTQTRDYVQTEKLREWLIDINETAIGDIIRTAEVLSHRKTTAIDPTHLEIWKELYEFLTTEEFTTLYQSLQQKKYENEEIVVHQGALQTALYFVNSGAVKLFFRDKGNRVLIKTMGKGEIIGAGSFFDASVWTVSVASVGITDISILRHEKMLQWKEEFPSLEQKLRDFCFKFESIEHILSQSAQDRREHERYSISGRVATLLLDSGGQATGVSSEVELSDISRSGVAYFLSIEREENARLILGRKVKVMLPFVSAGVKQDGITGDILAVKIQSGSANKYSIHVKFETLISSLQLDEIVMAADKN